MEQSAESGLDQYQHDRSPAASGSFTKTCTMQVPDVDQSGVGQLTTRRPEPQTTSATLWHRQPSEETPAFPSKAAHYLGLTEVSTVVAACCNRGVRTSSPSDFAFPASEFCTTGVACPGITN